MGRVLILALGLMCAGSPVRAQEEAAGDEDFVVIVNEQSPFEETIAPGKLREVYLGRPAFVSGVRIQTVNRTDQEVTAAFLKKFTGMTLGAYKSHWVKKLMSEGGTGPKVLDVPEDVIRFVAETKGAVAYLAKKDLPAKTPGVRVLAVSSDKDPAKK